ncbi:hypothetical protein Q9966_003402 [Columba livia]|nr:hypothetical protein Q9966_003402 [Columba livia]
MPFDPSVHAGVPYNLETLTNYEGAIWPSCLPSKLQPLAKEGFVCKLPLHIPQQPKLQSQLAKTVNKGKGMREDETCFGKSVKLGIRILETGMDKIAPFFMIHKPKYSTERLVTIAMAYSKVTEGTATGGDGISEESGEQRHPFRPQQKDICEQGIHCMKSTTDPKHPTIAESYIPSLYVDCHCHHCIYLRQTVTPPGAKQRAAVWTNCVPVKNMTCI